MIRVPSDKIVAYPEKVRFPCGEVVFAGSRKGATDMLKAAYPDAAVIGCTSIVGDHEIAIVGAHGHAITGTNGTAVAGEYGEIHICWHDFKHSRYRIAVGYVGENGILPNVPYHVVAGKLVKKENENFQCAKSNCID